MLLCEFEHDVDGRHANMAMLRDAGLTSKRPLPVSRSRPADLGVVGMQIGGRRFPYRLPHTLRCTSQWCQEDASNYSERLGHCIVPRWLATLCSATAEDAYISYRQNMQNTSTSGRFYNY